MSTYVCEHCGVKADSKCVKQRNVFIDDDMLAILEARFYPLRTEEIEPGKWALTFTMYTGEGRTKEEAIEQFLTNTLSLHRSGTDINILFKQIACRHKWVPLTPCMFGCCQPAITV